MDKKLILEILTFVFSFIIGGIPTGYLITRKILGVDIRTLGSGNPGAANVYRTVGKWPGITTFIIDATKGFICVRVALWLFPGNYIIAVAAGALAICGHMWTIFLKFKGGKGVATSAGVFAALMPIPTLIAFGFFAFFVWLSGHISVGSIIAAAVLPIAGFFIGKHPWQIDAVCAVIAAVVIYKHIPNMKRLWANSELAFEDGSKKRKKNENK